MVFTDGNRFGVERADTTQRRGAGKRNLRQSEIKNLGMATLGDEDVCRLDVAVDNTFSVSGVERVGDIDCNRSRTSGSSGRPAMRCFSVTPSRYSMAMKARPELLRRYRKWCRC